MKNLIILVAIATLAIAGCGNKDESGTSASDPTTTTGSSASTATPSVVAVGYDVGSKKVGDKGSCAVCTIKMGKAEDEEEAKAVIDYEGKTYVFCDEAEKADFISDPKKYTGGK